MRYNELRPNSYWLRCAAHFATAARSDSFHLHPESDARRVHKRLWWGILFRDRILSLCLRRPTTIELDPELSDEQHFLRVADFQSEIGHSQVHDEETQLQLIEVAAATCRFVQCITTPLRTLYRYEHLHQRTQAFFESAPAALADIDIGLQALATWHTRTTELFPSPVTLDNTADAVSIFVNMLFCYHASVVFALNLQRVLLHETIPSCKPLVNIQAAADHLKSAMDDFEMPLQELVQARLAQYLPISVSALLTLPLTLQAINLTAARGAGIQESRQHRRLELFVRVLEAQRLHFHGSDFISEVQDNIVAYAKDEQLLSIGGRDRDMRNLSSTQGQTRQHIQWPELVLRRPRPLLRILFRLDHTLCTGSISPQNVFLSELPPELR